MLFTEPLFLFLFLPALLLLYAATPARLRNALLLAASLVFYAFGEKLFVWVLLLSIALNYFAALALGRAGDGPARRRALGLGVAGNLLLLVAFKYTDFLVANFNAAAAPLGLPALAQPGFHLPIGISFFTFMGISYLVDVYRRQIEAQRSLTDFALYITLFPHLIAGPIVRYGDIAAEIVARRVTRPAFAEGVRRFTVGFGKKMLVANTLALPADSIFALDAAQLTPALAWIGIACYTLQIYYDFSGYTDMAIGLARMFGFHFPENFNYPYVSRSITEFWKRWHISLSTWFRDYLFFPLGVRRRPARLYLNLLVVFFLCGLWHGASWNFVIWGLLHGALLVFERAKALRWLEHKAGPLAHVYTMLAVMVGWVFFRTGTLTQALEFLGTMFGLSGGRAPVYGPGYFVGADVLLAFAAGVVGSLPLAPWLAAWQERRAGAASAEWPRLVRAVAVMLVFVASAALSAAGTYSPFIYFRF